MRKIPLGISGKEHVVVDDADYKKVVQYFWHKSICGAAQRRPRKDGKRGMVFLHQQILGIAGKKRKIRHINGNRLDCRRKNMELMRK